MKLFFHSLITLAFCAACGVNAGPAEDLREADVLAERADVKTAMALLRRAADQNYAPAQARLADLLLAAEFEKEALVWYRKAAEQGEASGEFGLGRMYANGAAVKRDPAAALEWYRKAETKNFPPALEALAHAYREGDLGLAKDLAQANALEARRKVLVPALAKNAKDAKEAKK